MDNKQTTSARGRESFLLEAPYETALQIFDKLSIQECNDLVQKTSLTSDKLESIYNGMQNWY